MHPISRSLSRLVECLRLALGIAGAGGVLVFSGGGTKEQAEAAAKAAPKPDEILAKTPEVHGVEVKTVELTKPLKQDWVAAGKAIYDGKCLACHKLTGDRAVLEDNYPFLQFLMDRPERFPWGGNDMHFYLGELDRLGELDKLVKRCS